MSIRVDVGARLIVIAGLALMGLALGAPICVHAQDSIAIKTILDHWKQTQQEGIECELNVNSAGQSENVTYLWRRGVGLKFQNESGATNVVDGAQSRMSPFEPQSEGSPKWLFTRRAVENSRLGIATTNAMQFWLEPLNSVIGDELLSRKEATMKLHQGQHGAEVRFDVQWGSVCEVTLVKQFHWRPVSIRSKSGPPLDTVLTYASSNDRDLPILASYVVKGNFRSGNVVSEEVTVLGSVKWRLPSKAELLMSPPPESMVIDNQMKGAVTFHMKDGEVRTTTARETTRVSKAGGGWAETYAAARPTTSWRFWVLGAVAAVGTVLAGLTLRRKRSELT